MNKNTMMRVSLAIIFVSITLLIAALQIPHIGEGAPEWHTVRRPRIPTSTTSGTSDSRHADREIILYKRVCVDGNSRKIRIKTTAFWIGTLNCYCYFDDYGRLCAVPELR